MAGEPPTKRPCTRELQRLQRSAGLRAQLPGWHAHLRHAELEVPGLVVDTAVPKGEVLLTVPRSLHFSRPRCREFFEEVYEACEALPSTDPEKREEAADALCLAQLLLGTRKPGMPEIWAAEAELLRAQAEDFADHPYMRTFEGPSHSAEPELLAAQAQYVRTVYGCLLALDSPEVPKDLDEGLFRLAWLCLLTRRFGGPEGSTLVPGVDLLNHSPEPNARSDWDEESGSIMVTTQRDLSAGEEVCISYGELSNPLLFRTYGFTLPSRQEPCQSCTFTQSELLAEIQLEGLPNLHLNSNFVTDELAAFLQASSDAAAALRRLLKKRLASGDDARPVEDDASRIAWSEYQCVKSHAEILDDLAGDRGDASDQALRRELQLLHKAGLLKL